MPKRYINNADALNTLKHLAYETALNQHDPYVADVFEDIAKNRLETWVDLIPTADVIERKKGKWKVCNILDYAHRPTGRKVGKCSHCGHLTDEFRTIVEASKKLTNFCPECGSYNREESDNGRFN